MESQSSMMRDTRFSDEDADHTILYKNIDGLAMDNGCSNDQKRRSLTITAQRGVDLGIISRRFQNIRVLRLVDTTIAWMVDVTTWIKQRKLLRVESTRWDVLYMLQHRLTGYCQCAMSDLDDPLPSMFLYWAPTMVPVQNFVVRADPTEGGASKDA